MAPLAKDVTALTSCDGASRPKKGYAPPPEPTKPTLSDSVLPHDPAAATENVPDEQAASSVVPAVLVATTVPTLAETTPDAGKLISKYALTDAHDTGAMAPTVVVPP